MKPYYDMLYEELNNAETPREAYEEVLRLKKTIEDLGKENAKVWDDWRADVTQRNKRIESEYNSSN